jgi:hypothetical protein
MAFDTGRFIPISHLHLPRLESSMRLVTVHATNRAFRQTMAKRFGKGRLRFSVARETELVRLARQKMDGLGGVMDLMALSASHLILSMQAAAHARQRFCASVAFQAVRIDLIGGEFLVGDDLAPVASVHVSLSRTVAGFTTSLLPAFLGV